MDTNKTRVRKKKEDAKYVRAYEEVMGKDSRNGVYYVLKYNALPVDPRLATIIGDFGSNKPSAVDFVIDVERTLTLDWWDLSEKEQNKRKSEMGKKFMERGIAPVKRYFNGNSIR